MKKFTFLFSFVLVMSCLLPTQSNAQDLESDSLALVALYDQCGGANWAGYETWKNGPLSTWRDVTIGEFEGATRVTHVLFKEMTLTGTLPEALGDMTAMSGKIEIHNNPDLVGTFPAFIWNWTGVERLQIKNCGFTAIDTTGLSNMKNLTEINTEATPFAGEIPVTFFTLPKMQKVYLENGMWSSLPADMPATTATPLTRFYLNGNQFTDLPDISGMNWGDGAKIKLQDNMLTFEDIVPNMPLAENASVAGFTYSPQGPIGADMNVYADAGSAVTLESNIGGTATTIYTWVKGVEEVVGDTKDLTIEVFDAAANAGTYYCLGQDPAAPGLDILSGKKMLAGNPFVSDSLALVALYDQCGGANWAGFETWMDGPLSTWRDVTIGEFEGATRVTHVLFKEMTLTGTLPEALGDMTAMSGKIEFHNNPDLVGTFPAFIWNWTGVERLQIKNCGFTAIDTTGLSNMKNLTEINTEATPFAGEIPVTFFTLPKMQKVYLENGMWTALPADMPAATATPLTRFYLNGNQFTDLPDISGMNWGDGAKIKLQDNMLTFEDIVPNMPLAENASVAGFTYSPQGPIGADMNVYADAGSAVTLESNIGGTATTVYTWIKGVEEVVGDTKDLTIEAFDAAANAGTYYCLGQDPAAPGLDILSGKKMLAGNPFVGDSLALVALYDSCGGANWAGYETWKNGPLSTWRDVTIGEFEGATRVTHVLFKEMTLTGTLPEALGDMTAMSGKIEFHNNPDLVGTFPAFIWNWTGVERLQIKNCGFTAIDTTGLSNMKNLTEINTEATPFAGEIPVTFFTLPKMQKVYLENGMWTALPADMPAATATPLTRFYLNGNQFTDLPDISGMNWGDGAKIKLQDNMLTFEDIVPNMPLAENASVAGFTYSPQGPIGADMNVYADAGSAVTLESNIGGTATTVYTWIKGVEEVVGDTKDLTIEAFDAAANAGTYYCLGQDPAAPGLDILSGKKMLAGNPFVSDSLALVALYNECGGANWTGFETWMAGPLSTWKDVTVTEVDGANRVTHVNFKEMTLTGTLPDELGNMTAMAGKIEIHNQPGLTGTFPAFIWNWTGVERLQIKNCGYTAIDVTGMESMVNLYEINTEGTPFEGEIPVEFFNLPLMQKVYLEDGKWNALPADMPIPTPTPLTRFYVNGNEFTDLSDLTGMVWGDGAKIKVMDNMLTFEDLEPNMWIASDAAVAAFDFSPQALLAEKDTITIVEGEELSISVNCGGANNIYTWIKDGEVVEGVTTDELVVAAASASDAGDYQCLVQNSVVAGLDLVTDTFTVVVDIKDGVMNSDMPKLRINGNPVYDILSIDSEKLIENIVITNIAGAVVKRELVNTNNLRTNISNLKDGIYLVQVKGKDYSSVLRVVKK